MKPFLIIRTGGTFPAITEGRGDFEDWTANSMGLTPEEWECADVQSGKTLPDPTQYAGCVITGSHDMLTENTEWMQQTQEWIPHAIAAGLPMVGICFGHEIMAQAFGGSVDYRPDGMEIGTVPISLTDQAKDDPLFSQLPAVFPGHVVHSQSALKLPEEAVLLASSARDAHQAFRIGKHAWGVQFHPEFDAKAILFYARNLEEKLVEQKQDVDAIVDSVEETPISAGLMPLFVEYCRNR